MLKQKVDLKELDSAFKILEQTLPGYEIRPQQMKMAGKVHECLTEKKNLLIEAGTGVGKSFAYLIPAILSQEKTVVSTASIALQDQLVNKDLAFLRDVLPVKFSYAILKGKNNYLCLKRENEYAELDEKYLKFREWVSDTETGDKDELPFIPEFWSKVCGDTDDCSVTVCPYYKVCFYYRHYRNLYKYDVIVVNHHLLMYDLLSEFNLMPFHNQLIIDEAHQLEHVISHVLGSSLSHSKITWLLYRLKGLKIAVDHIFEPVDGFFKRRDMSFQSLNLISDDIVEGLNMLKDLLALDNVLQRLTAFEETLDDTMLRDRIQTTLIYIRSLEATINDFISRQDKDRVYFMTREKGMIELKSNLVESRKPFQELVDAYDSLIMTSATLTAGGAFGFIRERLGMKDFQEMVVGSPFDYKRQALLYINRDLPVPDKENSESFFRESLKTIEDLITASRGRALVLFTSHKNLKYVSARIKTDYPVKSQGDMPPAKLIQWLKKTPNAVLLATATFWQGIDIKGEQLSLVVIVKMPFGTPGDPVYDERCRRLQERWFTDLALPSAILLLRQGFGRLIRSSEDYGVVALLDPRLVRSSYGKTIISSLPEMDVVHTIEPVKRFFDAVPNSNGKEHRDASAKDKSKKSRKVRI
jgi:ATP-dependent DNA helicase DinG